MGAKSGFALKLVQWFNRIIQFLCAAVILGIYSYFLAALHNHDFHIPQWVRAVEGISGAAVLYTIIGILLLCCLAGLTFFSLLAIILDVAFIGAFIYVAWENRHGAGSCNGVVDTPFGRGQAGTDVRGDSGFTNLPSFRTACRLQTASLAVAIIAIFFFIFSILMEVVLARHHRKEKRFGPSPANNYTSGYGSRRGGLLGRFMPGRKKNAAYNDNALPEHTHPDQLEPVRQSYATETTAVNDGHAYGAGPGGNPYKYENTHELPSGQTHGYTNGYGQTTTYGDGVYNRP